jgi:hypothetical protein
LNPVHIFPHYFHKLEINIVFPCGPTTPSSRRWSLSFRYLKPKCMRSGLVGFWTLSIVRYSMPMKKVTGYAGTKLGS